jgi:hypothetical protein
MRWVRRIPFLCPLAVALTLSSASAFAAETLIPAGSVWRYLDDGSDQPAGWKDPGFDDLAWPSGRAPLGYGEGDEATILSFGPDYKSKFITTYFRSVFNVADVSAYTRLILNVQRDDGAVIYLNGTEVFRTNILPGPVEFDTPAASAAFGYLERSWQLARIDPSRLVDGSNVLAVELHQWSGSTSDARFDLSLEADLSSSVLEFAWAGAVTPTSVRVNAKTLFDSTAVRLFVSRYSDMSWPRVSGYYSAEQAINNRVVSIPMRGLRRGTWYTYALEIDGQLDLSMRGHFMTPVAGPASFTFGFASCANTGSSHPVFDTIRSWFPRFFVHMGDFHNENIDVNDIDLFRATYDTVLASPAQSALYRSAPIVYMWDDHDYGPDDSDRTAPGREAARRCYQEYVPHYPLAAGSGDVPIYQSFSVGRVKFIVTDNRSERSPFYDTDTPEKTVLGWPQKQWFFNELLSANGVYPVIVWVNTFPWISSAGREDWSLYSCERQEIADFIAANSIQGLFMVSGDAHMLAIDDGTNNDYAAGGGASFPVMHAAALDDVPHMKGGPYSEGAYPGRGQFGLMTIYDDGVSPICIAWSGRNVENTEVVNWGTCLATAVPSDTDSDGVGDVADCAFADPGTWSVPVPVSGVVLEAAGGAVLFSWNSQDAAAGPSTVYDIVRGNLGDLRQDGGFELASCLATGIADTPYVDSSAPPAPGQGEYFLLRAVNACGSSGYGHTGPLDPRFVLLGDLPCALP